MTTQTGAVAMLESPTPERHKSLRADLVAGSYWVAIQDIEYPSVPDEPDAIDVAEGTMLMLEKAHLGLGVSGVASLLNHPSESPRALRTYPIDDFLDLFELVDANMADHIRRNELAMALTAIDEAQETVNELLGQPERILRETRRLMADDPDVRFFDQLNPAAGLLDHGDHDPVKPIGSLSKSHIDHIKLRAINHREMARAQEWLVKHHTDRMSNLARTIGAIHLEWAKGLEAGAAEQSADADRALADLRPLALHTGEGVEVQSLRAGDTASDHLPYDIHQRCLYLSEESTISVEFGGERFDDLESFSQAIDEDEALIDRMLPTPRCIVAVQSARTDETPGEADGAQDDHGLETRSFLLIRDGENLHAVIAPISYATRLFPTDDEDGGSFRGIPSDEITLAAVSPVDHSSPTQRQKQMYLCLLLLLEWLYRNTGAMGSFDLEETRGQLDLLDIEIQNAVFRFIPDDDDSHLLANGLLPTVEFIRSRIAHLRPSSTVVGNWPSIANMQRAPGCFSIAEDRFGDQVRRPCQIASIETVSRRGEDLVVKIPTQAVNTTSDRTTQKSTVLLGNVFDSRLDMQTGLLVLDGLISEDILTRLHCHTVRRHADFYVPMLMAGLRALIDAEQKAQSLIERVASLTGESEILCRRLIRHVVGTRSNFDPDKLTPAAKQQLVADTVQCVRFCAATGLDYRLDPIIAHPDDPLVHPLSSIAYLSDPAKIDLIRISLDSRGQIVLYSRPTSRAPIESAEFQGRAWLTRDVYTATLLGSEILIQSHRKREYARLGFSNAGEITLWQRDIGDWPSRQQVFESICEPIEDDRLASAWIRDRRMAPAFPVERIRDALDCAHRQLAEQIDLLLALPNEPASTNWLRSVTDAMERDMKKRSAMVGAPEFHLPLALVARARHTANGPNDRDIVFHWLIWRADAISLGHLRGGAEHREQAEMLTRQAYEQPEKWIDGLAQMSAIGELALIPFTNLETSFGIVDGQSQVGAAGAMEKTLQRLESNQAIKVVSILAHEKDLCRLLDAAGHTQAIADRLNARLQLEDD